LFPRSRAGTPPDAPASRIPLSEAVLKISGAKKFWDFAKYQSLILPYSNGQYLFCRMDFFPEKSGLDIFKTASQNRDSQD